MLNKKVKITWITVNSLLLAITFFLIPIDLLASNVPEWLISLFAVLSVAGLAGYLLLFKTKLVTKIVLPVVFAIIALVSAFFPYVMPYWNSYSFKDYNGTPMNYDEVISYTTAKHDLDSMMHHLQKVHPAFKAGLTDDIKEGYSASMQRLNSADKITVNMLRKEIQSIINPLHDAHTTTYNSYPNDLFLKDAPKKSSEGYGINSVNGKSVAEIIESAKPYFSYETERWINIDLGSIASLEFYGFSAPYEITWSHNGNEITEVYSSNDFVPYTEFLEEYNKYFTRTETPFVYYEIDEGKSLAVLTLTECIYDDIYISCVNKMFTEIKQKSIKNVAVDVRGNGGGHSGVANEFVKYLPVNEFIDCPSEQRFGFVTVSDKGLRKNNKYENLIFDGNVFVLTDNQSFSSAMDFAQIIQDNKLGKIIGESPANKVTGYGDVAYFRLPETGLFMQISTKKWYRCDSSNTDEYVMPDHPCDGNDVFKTLYSVI